MAKLCGLCPCFTNNQVISAAAAFIYALLSLTFSGGGLTVDQPITSMWVDEEILPAHATVPKVKRQLYDAQKKREPYPKGKKTQAYDQHKSIEITTGMANLCRLCFYLANQWMKKCPLLETVSQSIAMYLSYFVTKCLVDS
ncbi:hypothetical protein BC941DRAFT_430975 [Chlamydoabsidia padenii]|nr:hypothetical protein BC941DRAFT_430975 [Chlamydoabsidia padenii]